MTDRLSLVALREIRSELSKKPVVLAILGAGLILGLSGPFGTFEEMTAPVRIVYWVAIAIGTYVIGVVVATCSYQLLHAKNRALQIACSSVCAGLMIGLFLLAFNWAFVGGLPPTRLDLLKFLIEVVAITAIITTGIDLARRDTDEGSSQNAEPAILERLAFEKRGPLVALSVTDHYVDVVTTKGQEMILMRLADAMREVGSVKGIQVHRSHWIALDQVVSVERVREGANLTMTTGQTIPVSRSKMSAVREAGLLAK